MMSRKEAELLEQSVKKIQKIDNMVGKPFYDLSAGREYKAHIRVDNTVAHGLFRPDPKKKEAWLCSEQTYRAMKKDIFALDEQMLDLADNYLCASCKTTLDRQFWNFCPYCGEGFKK
ncbi:MAG: hypothetical protein WD025_08990 [Bacteriovoracaceae bacterium]